MSIKVLATLGPSSLNKVIVQDLTNEGVNLFRINLSHTSLDDVKEIIKKIQSWTDIPICLDSEGAQIRNQDMNSESVYFKKGDKITIHHKSIVGDGNNISFTPDYVSKQLQIGDIIRVDFNSATIQVMEDKSDYLLAIVVKEGYVGSNKAADVDRHINLDAVTYKDEDAFKIGLEMGIEDFSL